MTNRRFLAAAAAGALLLAAGPALAQMDPGSFREHPVVKHYPGALIDSHDEKEFDAVDTVVGYTATPQARITREEVEGRVYKTFYVHQGGVSALQVMRNYETALATAGFTTVVTGKVASLPSMEDARDGALFGAFKMMKDGRPAMYVNILIDPNVGEPVSRVVVVEPEQMQQVYAVDASSLYAGLSADGRVSPSPSAVRRASAIPLPTSQARTASARCCDRVRLAATAPTLSVWPSIFSRRSG